MAKENEKCTAYPVAAVVMAVMAVESFLNVLLHFMIRKGKDNYRHFPLLRKFLRDPERFQRRTKLIYRWMGIGRALYGRKWYETSQAIKLSKLIQIRNELIHFKGNYEEILSLDLTYMSKFKNMQSEDLILGDIMGPSIDRLLNHSLALWSVDLAESSIQAFCTEWVALVERSEAEALLFDDADFEPDT